MDEPQYFVRPDVTLAYSVQGHGPVVALVGAPAGRAAFAGLAGVFAESFTVITHDPRGIGASRRTPEMAAPTPAVLAEDVAALVDDRVGVPALFVGTSGGAITLLELAKRHPQLIGTMVLHEPPLLTLLGDSELSRRAAAAFAVAEADPQRAVQEFFDLTGAMHCTGPGEVPPAHFPVPPLSADELEKNRYFLGQMAGPTVCYEPDLDAVSRVRAVVCAGSLSHQQLARRAAQVLADQLGQPLADMPGNHLGASAQPEEFASALRPYLDL